MFNTQQNSNQSANPGQEGQAAAVPVEPQQPAQQQQQPGAEQQFVTKAELDQRIEESMKLAAQKAQSLAGQAEARVKKEIAKLEKVGIRATPEQVAQIIAQEDAQNTSQPASEQAAVAQSQNNSQQAQPATSSDPLVIQAQTWAKEDNADLSDPFMLEAYLIMSRSGVHLQDSDPEVKEINTKGSAIDFLNSVSAATQKAALRIGKQGDPSRAAILMNGNTSTTPAHADLSGIDTLALAFKNITG